MSTDSNSSDSIFPGSESVEIAPDVFSYSPAPEPYSHVPEDLRVPWGFSEIAVFVGFLLLVVVIIAPLGVATAMLSLGMSHHFLPETTREKSIFLLANQPVWSLAVMFFLWFRLRVRYDSPFWSTLQWKPLRPLEVPRWLAYAGCLGGGCTMALVVGILSEHLGKTPPMPIEEFFNNPDTALALILMSVFLAPVVEETMFRGFLYPVLARTWGVIMGVLITGTLFGLLHSYQLGGSKSHVALLILVGVVLTTVRAASRSTLASWLVHLGYNGFLAVGYFASTGFHTLPAHH